MRGAPWEAHESPIRPAHLVRERRRPAGGPAGAAPLGTDGARAGAVHPAHPVPKSFRSKERQS